MSESNQAGGQTQNPAGDEQESSKNTVAYETHQKLLNEKKRAAEELRVARETLNRLEAEKREQEEKALREKEDFKKLFEARDNELKTEKEKRAQIENQINDSKKMRSFLQNVGSPVDERYWNLIDLDKIQLDPNTGKPDESMVKSYADEFKKTYWEVLNPATGRIPNDAPGRDKSGLTYEEWLKLPYNEKKKRQSEIVD